MKKHIYIYSIIILCAGILTTTYFICIHSLPNIEENIKIKEFVSSKNDVVYLKKITRGLNYCRIIISKTNEKLYNQNEDYICTSSCELFYRFLNDTLNVYTISPMSVPTAFTSSIFINPVVLSNAEYIKLFESGAERRITLF